MTSPSSSAMSDFWELHRRLGECYDADMGRRPGKGARSARSSVNVNNSSSNPFHHHLSLNASPRRAGPAESPRVVPPDAPPAMMKPTYSAGSQNVEEDYMPVMTSRASNTPGLQEMRALSGAMGGQARNSQVAASQASDAGPLPFVAIPRACWRKKAKRTPSNARSRVNVSVGSNLLHTFSGVEKKLSGVR